VILRFLGGFCQLVDNVLWRPDIRISHPQIDNILSGMPGIHFDFVNGCKYIGWETIESGESSHKNNLFWL
jgi:hypothetical protein